MTSNPITAWIIKLEWSGDHAAVDDPIVDIVSEEKGADYVSDYVQCIHDLLFLDFQERAGTSRPYSVNIEENGNVGTLIHVGHNPYLTARKFSGIRVETNPTSGKDMVTADGLESTNVMSFGDKISNP